jgi:hypothetical protein
VPISDPEWESISQMVEAIVKRVTGTRADFFTTGRVVKVDAANKCVYLAEFGDQPIPIVGFNYTMKYYDEGSSGTIKQKDASAVLVMPEVGQSVLVAREMGTRRLPRALGVIQGKNWIVAEEE